MTLKRCPNYDKLNTTKTATKLGVQNLGYKQLLFNCSCGGTFCVMNRRDVIELYKESQAQEIYGRVKGAA